MSEKFVNKFDIILFISTALILIIGFVSIYSATHSTPNGADFYLKQIYFGISGLGIVILISYINPKHMSKISYFLYGLSVVLLILVLLFGKVINGNKSWFYIGGFGIQPSEFAKITTVLAIATFIGGSEEQKDVNKLAVFIKSCIFVVIPVVLIKLQNDTGTTLVFLSFLLPMFFWAGLSPFALFVIISPIILSLLSFAGNLYFYIGLLVILIALFTFKRNVYISIFAFILNLISGFFVKYAYDKLEPYQQKRILAVFDPASDPLGSGYNVIQSKVAIGSGGIAGKGFLQGTQTQLKFIPEQWTDFIFCMIGEEFGFVGSGLLIILFLILISKMVSNAYISKNRFFSLTCIGFASIFLFHFTINVGMTVGIMPVIGIPLPLVSYGISSLLSFLIMIGIAMATYRYKTVYNM